MLGYKNPKVRTPDRMMRLQRFIVGSAILGYVFEDILGINSPMPNLVRASIDLVENGESPEEVAKGVLNLALEGVEVVPLAGSVVKYRGSLFGAVADALEKGLELRSPEAVVEAVMRLSGVPATSQLKKSYRQFKQDASVYDIIMGGKYTPKEKRKKRPASRVYR